MAVDRGQTTLASELERARRNIDDERDRGLLVELTTGALRWRGELDGVIAGASGRAIDAIDPTARAILRVGTYQLLHLDRIPAHAAVDEAVESARHLGQPRAAGFINGVLRAIERGAGRKALPERPATSDGKQQAAYLATALSHPLWLVERWLTRFGFEQAEAWCRFNNMAPAVTVRSIEPAATATLLETLRATGIDAAEGQVVRDAITLPPGALGRLPPAIRESLHVQDEGSQLVAHVTGAAAGLRCLDLCAAPGGKTIVLWADMAGDGELVASDRRPSRVRLLRSMLARARVPARLVALDATATVPFRPVFDRVLVDAPCSGLGTVRREPDVKWSRHEGDLPRLAATQSLMLGRAAEAVRPGGRLVYATCSSEPEENERIVEAFLANDPRFVLERASLGPHVQDTGALVDESGYLRTLPFRDGLDAYFAAVLVRSTTA
jgi:16S rRNA (cytosine967-C5)-methyltransferase